jgi:hypothetical protein
MFRCARIFSCWTMLVLSALVMVVPRQVAAQATPVMLRFAPAEAPKSPTVRPKIIFVLGQGDPATAGKLISALVEQLARYKLYFGDDNWLVPEPTWTLDTFLAQCANDREHTQGAFVVGLDSTASIVLDHFFSRSAYVDLTAHILYAQCDMTLGFDQSTTSGNNRAPKPTTDLYKPKSAPTSKSTPKAAFVWFAYTSGHGNVNTLTLVTPIALSVGLGSLVTAFIPSKSQTTTTVQTFPASPPPGTQNTTSSMSAFTPSQESSLAAAVYAGGAAYAANQLSVPTGDQQTWYAVYDAITKVANHMHCPSRTVRNDGTPMTTPRPPTEAYPAFESQGSSVAPFCEGWAAPAVPVKSP